MHWSNREKIVAVGSTARNRLNNRGIASEASGVAHRPDRQRSKHRGAYTLLL